jgi:amino acid adenylation domain-containing protein
MADTTDLGSPQHPSSDDDALLQALLAEEGVELASPATTIRTGRRPDRLPLSYAQELLWLLDRASPGMTAYKMVVARHLTGPLDVDALERGLRTIVGRHESLRTRFPVIDGEAAQVIDPHPVLRLERLDLRQSADPEGEATAKVVELSSRPFDMGAEPLFRAALLRIADNEHVLLLDTHHMVFDGWSRDVMMRELAECYQAYHRGVEPDLAALPIQFADFAVWQREHLSGARLEELLAFWRGQLGDVSETMELPTDRSRASSPGFAGAKLRLLLPRDLLAELKQLARRHDATLYMVLLAGYMTVLHRYSGNDRVLVGSGSAGRTQSETEGLIGYLNNTLVQRGDFAADPTFAALLAQVRESALGAYDHQEVPLEKLVLELRGKDAHGDAPLFQAVLTMQDTLESSFELDGVAVRPFGVDIGATKFDLTLFPAESDQGLWLTLQYRSDLYESATAQRLLGHLQRVLEAAVADAAVPVSRMPILTADEVTQLEEWNRTAVDFGAGRCIHQRFEDAAARTPDAVAVISGEVRLTYGELDRRANQLAHRLGTLGVSVGTPVGIAFDRSVDAMIAVLGILKAGGCYVPLSTDAPVARLAQQLAESGVKCVVTRAEYVGLLPTATVTVCIEQDADALASLPSTAPAVPVGAHDLAYVLFTSGSTGVPKGVAVTHANLANYTSAISAVLGAGQPLHCATVSTLAADLGNTAIFPALTSGGTLHVLAADVAMDGTAFAAYGRANTIDVLKITPSHLRALMSAAGASAPDLLPRRWLVLGGELCPWDVVGVVQRIGRCRVLNHYGPTETTVGASVFAVTERSAAPLATSVPIGLPLANVQLHVLDAQRQRVPVGVPGELYIGGAGVAAGYLNQADLTSERFVELPGMGRVYRTGDRVRRHPGGAIEFLGRADGQVKVRGFRVELGEIEQVIRRLAGVDQAVVMAHGDADNATPQLVAYAVPAPASYATAHAERPTPERIKRWVAEQLPDFMVPSAVIMLEALPLTANGKVDRRALPMPGDDITAATGPVAPRTETELSLVTIWSETLKRDQIGIHDNFFELGGHSLLAIRVLGKVSRTFGVRLALRTLFESPTIEALAVTIEREKRQSTHIAQPSPIKAVPRHAAPPTDGGSAS